MRICLTKPYCFLNLSKNVHKLIVLVYAFFCVVLRLVYFAIFSVALNYEKILDTVVFVKKNVQKKGAKKYIGRAST